MRQWLVISCLLLSIIVLVSFTKSPAEDNTLNLRKTYSRPPSQWPKPFTDPGVEWRELGALPESPLQPYLDSLQPVIELGKILFFDTRLSGSGKIACASCHQPELSWTDGKTISTGHEGALNKRNSPTLQNVWFYKKLFWDGRARNLEDQAFAPINSESEMHGDMRELPRALKKIKGYSVLFDSAYGYPGINPDRIATALAVFQRTLTSSPSRFDQFLAGKRNALNNSELRGLHLFRTKGRCMNCHHGSLFTDNQFHNNGFHLNGDPANDKGLYHVTHAESDIGKFKTPSLRDVTRTGPWMHNGMMKTIRETISHYNKGAHGNGEADRLVKMLYLTPKEQNDLVAFLEAISAPPKAFVRPRLPE